MPTLHRPGPQLGQLRQWPALHKVRRVRAHVEGVPPSSSPTVASHRRLMMSWRVNTPVTPSPNHLRALCCRRTLPLGMGVRLHDSSTHPTPTTTIPGTRVVRSLLAKQGRGDCLSQGKRRPRREASLPSAPLQTLPLQPPTLAPRSNIHYWPTID